MRVLVLFIQSSIAPERAMNGDKFRRRNVIKRRPEDVKNADSGMTFAWLCWIANNLGSAQRGWRWPFRND
jgi:hypothetical protein